MASCTETRHVEDAIPIASWRTSFDLHLKAAGLIFGFARLTVSRRSCDQLFGSIAIAST